MTFARNAADVIVCETGSGRGVIMRDSMNIGRSLTPFYHRQIIISLVVVALLVPFTASPCCAIQWPWTTTHKDLIRQRLTDIWQAILENDKAALKQYVMGFGTQTFIAQERRFIQTMGIKSYDLKVRSIQFDTNKHFAFVDFDRIGTTNNGSTMSHRFLKTFKRIGNDWKLLTNVRKKKSKQSLDE
jgi:hypothetical protein